MIGLGKQQTQFHRAINDAEVRVDRQPECPENLRIRRILRASAAAFFWSCLFASAAFAAIPELPRVFLDTTYSPPVGNTIIVNGGGNLQTAINNALPGDTIVLQAGATFTGTFILPDKGSTTKWIYIRSSAYASLPAPGNRVSPANVANMATISGTGIPVAAIQTLANAHHYRFVGIEFKPDPGLFSTGIVRLGNGETNLAQLPHDIVIDRCYVHGDPTVGGRRGITLNAASAAVIDSYVSDFKEVGADSQAIAAWSTPGPLKINNNYLDGAGENILFGGADPTVTNMIPSDIEIRGNYFFKPVALRPMSFTVKNLFELKNAQRTIVEGNIFENDWLAQQDFAINIKSANAEGTAPWSVTRDFTFRHNIIRHGPSAIKFCALNCDSGVITGVGQNYLIQNNLFYDINSVAWGGVGNFFQTANPIANLVIDHNTVIHDGSPFSGGDGGAGANTGFQFTDNIVQRGPNGFKGSGAGDGNGTLNLFFPGFTFAKNVVAGGTAGNYPPNNFFPADYNGVGFVNSAGADYRLAVSSPFKNAGLDGRDLGADVVAVNVATACVVTGQCGTPPAPPDVPNPFTFTDQTNVQPGAFVVSNAVTIGGIVSPAQISVTGGMYSVGCNGTFSASIGLIGNGQTVCVLQTAVLALNSATNTTLTVRGVSDTFTSTTAASLTPTGDADNDGIPNSVELVEGRNPLLKDNDVFTNNRLFAMQQYRDFLGREGDAGGITSWVNYLNGGGARAAVTEGFFSSNEFQGTGSPVVRLYFAYFLRIPDYGGLTFWIGQFRAGVPLATISNAFAGSAEFLNRYGALTNSQFVDLVYQNVLGRAADASGKAFWLGQLNGGMPRGSMMIGFSESAEYLSKIFSETYVTMMYVGMLKREPDTGGFTFWVGYLDAGNSGQALINGFLGAPEYRSRFLP